MKIACNFSEIFLMEGMPTGTNSFCGRYFSSVSSILNKSAIGSKNFIGVKDHVRKFHNDESSL